MTIAISEPANSPNSASEFDRDYSGVSFAHLPASAVIGAVETVLTRFYEDAGGSPERMGIDLSECTFIEIATLQHLISLLKERRRLGLTTILRLPSGERGLKARHFLRRWRFGEAVFAASGATLSSLVVAEDLQYFKGTPEGGDKGDPYAGIQILYNDGFGERVYQKEAYRFFGFKTWHLKEEANKLLIVKQERDRWIRSDPTVRETLRKQLKLRAAESTDKASPETHLADRIVLQAMTNALRHSNATLIQASSHMAQTVTPDPRAPSGLRLIDSFFTIVYWDDGAAMHSTLRAALQAGKSISYPAGHNASYLVKFERPETDLKYIVVHSSEIPDDTAHDERLLLSTIFPGVTCDVTGGEEFRAYGRTGDPAMGVPGHGLFVLVQTAIQSFRGSVAFRTANLFMNVSRLTEARWIARKLSTEMPDYYVKIKRLSEKVPVFRGNQVTIRLPLQVAP